MELHQVLFFLLCLTGITAEVLIRRRFPSHRICETDEHFQAIYLNLRFHCKGMELRRQKFSIWDNHPLFDDQLLKDEQNLSPYCIRTDSGRLKEPYFFVRACNSPYYNTYNICGRIPHRTYGNISRFELVGRVDIFYHPDLYEYSYTRLCYMRRPGIPDPVPFIEPPKGSILVTTTVEPPPTVTTTTPSTTTTTEISTTTRRPRRPRWALSSLDEASRPLRTRRPQWWKRTTTEPRLRTTTQEPEEEEDYEETEDYQEETEVTTMATTTTTTSSPIDFERFLRRLGIAVPTFPPPLIEALTLTVSTPPPLPSPPPPPPREVERPFTTTPVPGHPDRSASILFNLTVTPWRWPGLRSIFNEALKLDLGRKT